MARVGKGFAPAPLQVVTPRQADIAEVVETMAPVFVQCRDFGHAWRPWRTAWSVKERAYSSQLRCSRCKTLRVRLISATGAMVGSHYEYVDGYTIKGMGHLSAHDRDHIRLASMLHLAPQALPAEETA